MKILITTTPAAGHFLPMLPLARAAVRAGHDVVVATGADYAPMVEQRGLHCWPVGPTLAELSASIFVEHPRHMEMPALDRLPIEVDAFGAVGAQRATELVPLAMGWEPDVVIHEILEMAGAIVAARTGARHIVHGFGPLPESAADLVRIAATSAGHRWAIPDLAERCFASTYVDIAPPMLAAPTPSPWESVQRVRPHAGEVGAQDHIPDAFATFPFSQTVYLTLGTVFNQRIDVFATVLDALGDLPVNVVVTTGPGVDTDQLAPQPEHVFMTDHLAQGLILAHCQLVISHGGAGTTLGALCVGVPQLSLPIGAEQPLNAESLRRAGAGLTLDPDDLHPRDVRNAVLRLLIEPSFATAARRARAEIEAMPTAPEALASMLRARVPVAACR